jgi:CheY-like chemotaxis protein
MLSSSSARISEAESAAEALRIYSEDRPDIVLADIAMPGQDGYALIRLIRSLPGGEGGHVRAIAVSAYARREDRQRALKAGFNDHVCKPVQPDDVFDAIERVWVRNAPEVVNDDGEQSAKVH